MACIAGPFDKRRLRTRCASCRTLHLKCEGGRPCQNCISAGRPCKFEAAVRQPIRFRSSAYDKAKYALHPSRTLTSLDETCTWHFFSSFLPRNNFTARSSDVQQILKLYIHKSAGLRNAIVAVGALDLSRYAKTYYSITAAVYHKQAVSSLRVKLTRSADIDDATLWILLLLAIFELMFDTTGTGFMLHFTKGLPVLLRQRNFDHGDTSCCQTLLHTIQMLESMRSAPFWRNKESTLLEDARWQQVIQHATGQSSETQGVAVLYNLMSHFFKWSNTVFDLVLTVMPENMTIEDQQQLNAMAREGRNLYCQLQVWYLEHVVGTEVRTPLSLISSIYHCTAAISMNAILMFPHFEYWESNVQSSSATTLNAQVDELCLLLRCALRDTNLAGVLMFWPLRVAGSNSIRRDQAHQVLKMLREIRQRGFAVAQSFEDVLTEQWKQRSLL